MHQYKLISRKGEGTFSEVLKAQSLKTGNHVAIKCMKNHFASIEQVNELREIQALRKLLPHPHIIKLLEVLYDEPTGRLALVFELMDMNMYENLKDRNSPIPIQKIKYYMYQLLKALEHMHKNGIFHRDIKPENILISGDHVKLADFGSCRGILSERPFTEYISTRWYRPPECLMTDGYYDYKMDIWGVGCVFFEILSTFPLFPGNNELDQIHKIHNIMGTPNPKLLEKFKKHASHMELNFPTKVGTGIEKLLPNMPKDCLELIKLLLIYDPDDRITAAQALRHECFKEFYENDKTNDIHHSLPKKHSLGLSSHDSFDKIAQHTGDYEKNPYGQHPGFMKTKHKKLFSHNMNAKALPSVRLNFKLENIFKGNQNTNNTNTNNESSMDEEIERGGKSLPPLKHTSIIQMDIKANIPKKKEENIKQLYTNALKQNLSNQYLAATQSKAFKYETFDLICFKFAKIIRKTKEEMMNY